MEALLKDPNKIETRTKDVEDEVFSGKLGTTKANLKQLINDDNQIGIGFKKASENKASIDSFISTLGLEATDEKIYFNY
ncbi:MAG: hypothetical protein J6X03_04415 [Bacilli bacterium]|nr:hypothetical protein [Bacilli bacterium]